MLEMHSHVGVLLEPPYILLLVCTWRQEADDFWVEFIVLETEQHCLGEVSQCGVLFLTLQGEASLTLGRKTINGAHQEGVSLQE